MNEGAGVDNDRGDLIDARGRRWIATRTGKYVDPDNWNISETREHVEAIRPATCTRCGLLMGDDRLHGRWHHDQDKAAREQARINQMVLRGVMGKLRAPLAKVAETVPPLTLWNRMRRDDAAR